MSKFKVVVGGSPQAKIRWKVRFYKNHSSAVKRANKINEAHDMGVATVWILTEEDDTCQSHGK